MPESIDKIIDLAAVRAARDMLSSKEVPRLYYLLDPNRGPVEATRANWERILREADADA